MVHETFQCLRKKKVKKNCKDQCQYLMKDGKKNEFLRNLDDII